MSNSNKRKNDKAKQLENIAKQEKEKTLNGPVGWTTELMRLTQSLYPSPKGD